MKLRMQITKDKDIRFISHLEYVRTIGRAIRRAKLPAAYSEGFNPHLKFSLASALGVGVALPRGIRVLAADAVDTHHAALMSQAAGASYRVTLPYSKDVSAAVAEFNAAPELLFKKAAPKTKAKFKEIDVKFYIPQLTVEQTETETIFSFDCKITPTGSMKAVDLLNALNEQYGLALPVEMADIERLRLYRNNKNGKPIPMLNSDAVTLG